MEAGKPLLACPLCSVPVHVVSLSKERRFYLRHETCNRARFLAQICAGIGTRR
ncbi:hypothetical protein [Oryzomicrobium sp.]|uniref:hypothetical protein n=1 Tax=Oryzomicrobium sp. TaxID=1911578 RepID=UPI003FA7CB19